MDNQTSINLDNVTSSITPYERLIAKHLKNAVIMFFYIGSLTLGLKYFHLFLQSPLIRFVGKCAGFLASAISWIPAFLLAGIVLGKFDFPKEVFNLHLRADFSTAMAIVFFSIPIGLFLMKIMTRFISPLLFWSTVVFLVICFSLTAEYINALPNKYAYVLSSSVIGILYFAVMKKR